MSEPSSRRRALLYWWTAGLLLPILNPLAVLALLLWGEDEELEFLPAAALVALISAVLLWLIARGAWRGQSLAWRVALGLVAVVALSVAAGFAELVIYFDAACPDEGCFN